MTRHWRSGQGAVALILLLTGMLSGCSTGPGGGRFSSANALTTSAQELRLASGPPPGIARELEKHPADPYVLEPGDVLYIPIFWWHRVTYLEPCLSVAHWWAPSISDAWAFKRVRFIPWNIRNHSLAAFAKPMIPEPLRRIARKLRAPATR